MSAVNAVYRVPSDYATTLEIQHIAKVVIAINSALDAEPACQNALVEECLSVFPELSPLWIAAARLEMSDAGPERQVSTLLKVLLRKLDKALESTRQHLSDRVRAASGGNVLKLCWQDVAISTLKALRTFRSATNFPLNARQCAEFERLQSLLFEISDGRIPAHRSSDLTRLLHPVEWRRHTRVASDLQVTVWVNNRPVRAALLNISPGGCMLATDLHACRGESITIQAVKGRRIHGEVAWRSANHLGIKFTKELWQGDVFLSRIFEQQNVKSSILVKESRKSAVTQYEQNV